MNFSTTTTSRNDLSLPSEWAPSEWADLVETDTQMNMIAGDDEELLSATSFQAAGKVLEQWLSDGQHEPHSQRFHHQNQYQHQHQHHHQYQHQDYVTDATSTACDSSASSNSYSSAVEQEQDLYQDDATADVADADAYADADLASLMEVDEQIGENLLGDEVFGGGCEELTFSATMNSFSAMTMMNTSIEFSAMTNTNTNMIDTDVDDINIHLNEDDRRFLAPLLEDSTTTTMDYDAGYVVTDEESSSSSSPSSPMMNQKRYQEILKKLEASMKRSQETRKSLTMKTPKTEEYNRIGSVTGVLSSIENSSRQLQTLLQSVPQMQMQRTPV